MTKVICTENRICPFCKFNYTRTVYATDAGRGSICPKCHKRSDKSSMRLGRWKAPKLKICSHPKCNNTFYTNGTQKYCSDKCNYEIHLKQMREANKKRSNKLISSVK